MTFTQSLLIYFIKPILSLLFWLIIIEVILSWLVAFNIINLRNPIAASCYQAIRALINPILNPIRQLIPSIAGLDFSPIIAIFLLQWLSGYLLPVLFNSLG